MTPQEAVAAFDTLERRIGSDAGVFVSLNCGRYKSEGAVSVSVRPYGWQSQENFSVFADDFADLLAKTTAKWDEIKAEHRARRIRKMALEIIRITAEHGVCTDAALRAGKFSDAEVTDLGPDACTDATEIASNGPLSITPLAKANAA
tara:strand:+ start:39367 stop:39807 length:441 start_codon:yes stop_codon:yes gene_type:complete